MQYGARDVHVIAKRISDRMIFPRRCRIAPDPVIFSVSSLGNWWRFGLGRSNLV